MDRNAKRSEDGAPYPSIVTICGAEEFNAVADAMSAVRQCPNCYGSSTDATTRHCSSCERLAEIALRAAYDLRQRQPPSTPAQRLEDLYARLDIGGFSVLSDKAIAELKAMLTSAHVLGYKAGYGTGKDDYVRSVQMLTKTKRKKGK